ncbi:MAG: hypothetical protein WCA56_13310, partial [Xanthobacteraceae bacterium]
FRTLRVHCTKANAVWRKHRAPLPSLTWQDLAKTLPRPCQDLAKTLPSPGAIPVPISAVPEEFPTPIPPAVAALPGFLAQN